MKYEVPAVAPNKVNMTGRVAKLETVVSSVDGAIRELTARFDRIPPKGEQGSVGPKGERGPAGNNGKDGRDGKDGIGRAGRDGMNGTNGRDGGPGPDTAVVLAEARSEIAAMRSRFEALQQDFETLSLAFTSSSKKTAEYLQWLKSRVAARIAEMKEKNNGL